MCGDKVCVVCKLKEEEEEVEEVFCYKTSFSQAFAFATVLTASRSFCVHLATEKKEEEVVIFFFFLLLCSDFSFV